MEEVLNALVQAVQEQANALSAVADQITALKQTLVKKFPELSDELKAQVEADGEKNRNEVYEVQVSLAKVREAISSLPKAESGKA
jgi:recombinational DNA repair protein RecT